MPPGGTSLPPRRFPYATQKGDGHAPGRRARKRDVEDRRGGGGFGGGGIPIGVAGGGLGTVALILIALFFGVDPRVILNGGGDEAPQQSQVTERQAPPQAGEEDGPRRFVAQVLATTEDTWSDIFRRANRQYTPPNLVLFSGGTQSACGFAQTAVGPFYCPNDREGVSRHRLLPRHGAQAGRAGRIRPRLCHRA